MMCRVGRVILTSGSPQLPIAQPPSSPPQPQSRADVKLGWTRQSSTSSWDNTQSQHGPLRGMRVLDLTRCSCMTWKYEPKMIYSPTWPCSDVTSCDIVYSGLMVYYSSFVAIVVIVLVQASKSPHTWLYLHDHKKTHLNQTKYKTCCFDMGQIVAYTLSTWWVWY